MSKTEKTETPVKKKGGRILRAKSNESFSPGGGGAGGSIDPKQLSEWVNRTEAVVRQLNQADVNSQLHIRGLGLNLQAIVNILIDEEIITTEKLEKEISELQNQIYDSLEAEGESLDDSPPSLPGDDEMLDDLPF